jgi:hypothetical protein
VATDAHARHIFHYKIPGSQGSDHFHETENKGIAWIVKRSMSDKREALTWGASEDNINSLIYVAWIAPMSK